MKVRAEGIDAELGNNGITLHIAKPSNNRHVGTLRFGRAKLRWSKARTKKGPKEIRIEDLIDWLEAQ